MRTVAALVSAFLASLAGLASATVPVGFSDQVVVSGLTAPIGLDFLQGVTDWLEGPDGALWYVGLSSGELHRIAYTGSVSVAPTEARTTQAALYDVQGHRWHPGSPPGMYFSRHGRRVVVLR